MKITTTVSALAGAVAQVMPAVTGRSPLIVLNHLLFEGDTIRATDLEQQITYRHGFQVEGDGAFTADAKLLSSLLAKLPKVGVITLEAQEKGGCLILCGGRKYTLAGVKPDEFPAWLPLPEGTPCCTIPAPVLYRLLNEVAYAQSTNKENQKVCGVHLSATAGKFHAVAHDGPRMALSETSAEFKNIKATLPSAFVVTASRLLSDREEALSVSWSKGQIIISGDTITLGSLLMADTYPPNYLKGIEGDTIFEVVVDREEMLNAVQRAVLIAKEVSPRVQFDITEDTVKVSTETGTSSSEEEVATTKASKVFEAYVAYNGSYITDALRAFETEHVRWQFLETSVPKDIQLKHTWYRLMITREPANEEEPQTGVIMPMERT